MPTTTMRLGWLPIVCDQDSVVTALALLDDAASKPRPVEVLATVTVTGEESVVLPKLSVARATSVYVPFAGWLLHVKLYGEEASVPIAVPEANEHVQPEQ